MQELYVPTFRRVVLEASANQIKQGFKTSTMNRDQNNGLKVAMGQSAASRKTGTVTSQGPPPKDTTTSRKDDWVKSAQTMDTLTDESGPFNGIADRFNKPIYDSIKNRPR